MNHVHLVSEWGSLLEDNPHTHRNLNLTAGSYAHIHIAQFSMSQQHQLLAHDTASSPGARLSPLSHFLSHFSVESPSHSLSLPTPSSLPHRSIDELIGRANLLRQRKVPLAKTAGLDLSYLTTFAGPSGKSSERIDQAVHSNGPVLDDRILADPQIQEAIKNQVRGCVGVWGWRVPAWPSVSAGAKGFARNKTEDEYCATRCSGSSCMLWWVAGCCCWSCGW